MFAASQYPPHRGTRWMVYADVAARDITPRTIELEVYCREEGTIHDIHTRRRRLVATLARDPDFAGLVISDVGKIRCPRCQYKMVDVNAMTVRR